MNETSVSSISTDWLIQSISIKSGLTDFYQLTNILRDHVICKIKFIETYTLNAKNKGFSDYNIVRSFWKRAKLAPVRNLHKESFAFFFASRWREVCLTLL